MGFLQMANGSQATTSEHPADTAILCGEGTTLLMALNCGLCPRVIQLFLRPRATNNFTALCRQQGLNTRPLLLETLLSVAGKVPSHSLNTRGLAQPQ